MRGSGATYNLENARIQVKGKLCLFDCFYRQLGMLGQARNRTCRRCGPGRWIFGNAGRMRVARALERGRRTCRTMPVAGAPGPACRQRRRYHACTVAIAVWLHPPIGGRLRTGGSGQAWPRPAPRTAGVADGFPLLRHRPRTLTPCTNQGTRGVEPDLPSRPCTTSAAADGHGRRPRRGNATPTRARVGRSGKQPGWSALRRGWGSGLGDVVTQPTQRSSRA